MNIQNGAMSDRLVTRKWLSDRWELSLKTLRRMEKAGKLCPITLSSNTVRYRLSEIEAIEEDAAAR